MRYTARLSELSALVVCVILSSGCHARVAQAPTVPPPTSKPGVPTVALQASPATITRGESSTLTWLSSNANQILLSPGVGDVVAQGSRRVSPTDSVTYTITATGPRGSASASASIGVSVPYSRPSAASPTPEELFRQNINDAYFDYDKSDIRTDAKDALTHDAEFLRAHSDIRFTIEGHCDERGGEEYNLALGDRRAASAKQFLISLGLATDRIQTVSLGKEHPFCSSETESCYQQNRRGHFVIVE